MDALDQIHISHIHVPPACLSRSGSGGEYVRVKVQGQLCTLTFGERANRLIVRMDRTTGITLGRMLGEKLPLNSGQQLPLADVGMSVEEMESV